MVTEKKENFYYFQETASSEVDGTIQNTVEPPTKKLKVDHRLQMLKEAFGILKTAAEKPAPMQEINSENPELKSFCDFIFQKMKNYNKATMTAVQEQIVNILFHANHQANYTHTYEPQATPYNQGQQSSALCTPLTVMTDLTDGSSCNQSYVSSLSSHYRYGSNYKHHATSYPPATTQAATTPSPVYSLSPLDASPSQSIGSEDMEDLIQLLSLALYDNSYIST